MDLKNKLEAYHSFFSKTTTVLDLVSSEDFVYALRVASGPIVRCNKQFERMFRPAGINKITGRNIDEVFPKKLVELIEKPEHEVVYSNSPAFFSYVSNGERENALCYLILKLPLKVADDVLEGIFVLRLENQVNLPSFNLDNSLHIKPSDLLDTIKSLKNIEESNKKEFEEKNYKLKSSVSKLLELVTKDTLTNLGNRRSFDKAISREINRFGRYSHKVCLALLDLDSFKSINDKHGHSIGDQILLELGNILIESMRELDLIFRWGGDEFSIIFEADNESVLSVLEKLRNNVESFIWKTLPDKKITMSIGASMLAKGDTSVTWFDKSDKALYQAKAEGKNKVVIFDNK